MTAPGATGFSFTGIALEAIKGTAETSADNYIPVTRADGDDATDVLPDQGMRGAMGSLYGAVPGKKSASYEMEGDVYLDTIGYFLAGILGECAFDDENGPTDYEHVFTLNNEKASTKGQCPSYTIFDYNGLQARKYAGATLSNLTLRCSAQELLTYSASFTTKASATLSTPTPSFGTLAPIAAWTGEATLNGNAVTTIQEAEITFSRNVSVVQTVDGSQDPIQIWQGPISVSGRLMFVAPTEGEFLRYLNVSGNDGGGKPNQPSLELEFAQGGNHALTLSMAQIVYNSAKVERGEDFSQVSAQFDAVMNTTNVGTSAGFGPITATLVNGVDEDVYINIA